MTTIGDPCLAAMYKGGVNITTLQISNLVVVAVDMHLLAIHS